MTDTAVEVVPEEGTSSKNLGWALALICIAQLMVVLDATVVNIALPFVRVDLKMDPSNLQWIVTGFALAFGGLLLLGGRLGDLYGRRRTLMIGLTLFAVASALGGFAQAEWMILTSRALQGVGAALASPSALALITTTFPAGPQRNRAFSAFATMSAVGAAIGLILGGALTGWNLGGFHGWRLTFLINTPIGLGAALLAPRLLKESDSHSGELDVVGALTATLGLLALVFGVSQGGKSDFSPTGTVISHWGDFWPLTSMIGGVLLLVAFVAIETRVAHPLLPLRILRDRTRGIAFATMLVVPAAMFTMFFFLAQFIQTVMGFSPIETGLAFLPFTFGMGAGAAVSQNLVARIDPRFIAGTGTLLASGALFGMSRISVHDSASSLYSAVGHQAANANAHVWLGTSVNYWIHIFPFIVMMSVGMAMTFIPLMLTALHGINERDAGVGSGVLNTAQQLGGALGLGILATIAFHSASNWASDVSHKVQALVPAGQHPTAAITGASQKILTQGVFTHASTTAFFWGSFMMLGASALMWLFLNVKHDELQGDHAGPGAMA